MKKFFFLCFFVQITQSTLAYAIQGDIYPKNDTPNVFYLNLGDEILASSTGEVEKTFDMGKRYSTSIQCPDKDINGGYEIMTATTSLPPSKYETGYLQLNDELDVQVNLYTGNTRSQKFVAVPFENISNNYWIDSVCKKSTGYFNRSMASGGSGNLKFKLRKPIINGLTITSHKIADTYAKYGTLSNISPGIPSIPVSQLYIEAFILRVPDKCKVNDGQLITVEFGDVSSTGLNGNNYIKNVPIQVECEGGSFDTGSMNISLSVSGKSTPFSNELLNTDKNDLGILLKHNGEKIIPGSFYPLPSKNGNSWNWDLIASPMGNPGKEISEGEFNASATVVAKFE